ncbi:MAG TPA: MBG domain-containing protein, partial [Clostridia bacterium]|nr:MBG domain-containing protein [Clostridia bacterium]
MAKAQKLIIIAIVVFCLLCLVFIQNTDNTAYAYSLLYIENANSEENPYLISNSNDMMELSDQVLAGETLEGCYFSLTQSITLDSSFNPIGNLNNQFKGIFNGNNFSITLYIDKETPYNGIFGAIGLNGSVENLRVDGTIFGGNNTGSIAGYNLGVIDNCINYADINAKLPSVEGVGGIVGVNYGSITDCINIGEVCGNKFVGGIAGKNMSTGNSASLLNGIINLGDIKFIAGSRSYIIGGLVGQNDGTVKNGYNYSLITNSGDQIGSIIGYFSLSANRLLSKNCYNNSSKSAINVIGANAQTTPVNYANYTMYDFLGKTTLVFENGIMSIREFDIGYGYFPMLTEFEFETSITNLVRYSLFNQGTGTQLDPFIINNILQWDLFATNTLLHDYNNVYVELNCDIEQTEPLASFDTQFNGIFEGNNKTVTLSISVSNNKSFLGMFRYIGDNGIVKNINLAGWISSNGNYVGGIAGYTSGSIQNVISSARIIGNTYVGGIAAEVYNNTLINNLTNIKNTGSVEGRGMIGGIVGYGYNAMFDGAIINSGAVQGSNIDADSYFGGIFGRLQNSEEIQYTTLLNNGVINAPKGSYVGGLAGGVDNGDIVGSMNIGTVSGGAYIGGITGDMLNGILDSVGVVTNVTGASYVGGLIGVIRSNTSITDSYFSGKFYKKSKSTIEPATFMAVSNINSHILTLTNVYYNEDLIDGEGVTDTSLIIPELQGAGANYIELTNVNGSAHTISFSSLNYWNIAYMSLGFGYYPVSKNFDTETLTTINNMVRYIYFEQGDGSANLPFTIKKAQQLYNLSYLQNNYTGYESLEYHQTANITLDAAFTPIGTSENNFNGKYNGGNYKISNLNIVGVANAYYGLFGLLTNATIQKVALASGSITGNGYLGGITGYSANSTISNCYSLIDISSSLESYCGGIVGYLSGGEINACFNVGRINGAKNYVGGIVGYSDAQILNSFNMGMVTATSNAIAGGIAGNNAGGSIDGCYNSGTVKVTTESYVGGLCGTSTGTIIDCYTIAKIIYVTTAKSGALVGAVDAGVSNYLANCFYNINICGLSPHSATAITSPYAKTTQQMEDGEDPSFLEGFSRIALYSFGLASSQDSHYAPRLTIFTNTGNSDIENYSALSVRLRLFDWNDESVALWGSENNPYIISNRAQLANLSALNNSYDYSGYYFALANDIDMRVGGSLANFNPIGSYTNPQSYHAFNGIFDGKGYKLQYLSISSTTNYTGLFGMLGFYGSVKNLKIDNNSSITTTGDYVGSFVGRNVSENDAIDRCVSYATVTGNANIGGIVGYTYMNTTITNCLFAGAILGNRDIYGVVGMSTNSVSNVTTTNSWYIVDLSVGYLNNGYNSTLFIDGNGQVDVATYPDADNRGFIVFTLEPNLHFTGYYMDVNNNIVSANYSFYASDNTSLTSMYARFTLPVSTQVLEEGIINVVGEGNYYCGQTVTIKVSFLTYGYFVNIFNLTQSTLKEEYLDYSVKNDGEQVWITFIMPDSFEDLSIGKIVNIELLATSSYISMTTNETEYSGLNNDANVTILAPGIGYFEDVDLRYYYGSQKTLTDNTISAGVYEVRARLLADDSYGLTQGLFLGICSQTFTVNAKTLTINEVFDWTDITQKEYDATNYKNLIPVTHNIVGIIESDANGVDVYCTITWSSVNVGEGLDLVASNFNLTGSLSINYTINNAYEVSSIGQGKIFAKVITVSIATSDLVHTYNNSKPVVSNITVSGSLGEVILNYGFTCVDEENNPIPGWNNTWDVGTYLVNISTENTNYVVNLFQDYYVSITPIVINTVTYTGFNNLVYNGTNLATSIKGTYSTLYGGTDITLLTYYYYQEPTLGLNQVVNAGAYQAKPAISELNINYVLSESINMLTFNVSKAVRQNALEVLIAENEYTIGEGNIPLTVNNAENGLLVLNKTIASQRGAAVLINNAGVYELEMTAYGDITFTFSEIDCQNYFDSTTGEITLTINPQKVYIGIENRVGVDAREWYYGEVINLNFQYSWDEDQTQILSETEKDNILNYVPPIYRIIADELNVKAESYEVKILGAQSDNCRFYTASTSNIRIVPRPIEIIVASEDSQNTKIYGEMDKPINYSVRDLITMYIINELPNGMPLNINGNLEREEGENVGLYEIFKGTIEATNNPNYDLSYDGIMGSYEIVRKGIKLVMPVYKKNYGEQDPDFKLALASGYTFVEPDNINSINVNIVRDAGEAINYYNYNLLDYDGGQNYNIISIEIDTRFEIVKARADLSILSISQLYWGETLSTATIYGRATHLNKEISGKFLWVSGAMQVIDVIKEGDKMYYEADISFVPNNTNIESSTIRTTLPIEKRKLTIRYSGIFDYTYTGKPIETKYNLTINNVINGKNPIVEGVINETAKNVGKYTITPNLINDYGGVYELSEDTKPATLRIYPAVITVTAEGGSIIAGETFTPVIKYTGFVEGENESVLTSQGYVDDITNDTAGYYTLKPLGAAAQNYTFTYSTSTLIVKKVEVATEKVKLKGELAPEVNLTVSNLASSTKEYSSVTKSIDGALGRSILKPNNSAMVEYLKMNILGNLDASTQYEVKLATPIDESVTLYILNIDGSIKTLTDYSVNDDGVVVFKESNIKGIGVYKQKNVFSLILGYIPIVLIILALIAVVVLVIFINRHNRKVEIARRKKYL